MARRLFRLFRRASQPTINPLTRRFRRRWQWVDRVFQMRLQLQQLEDRTVPATVTWINATGGIWNVAANWQEAITLINRVPAAGDDAVIPDLTGSQTITVNSTQSVKTITSSESIALSAGTFTVGQVGTDATALNSGLVLSGGTLTATGVITLAGTSSWSNGSLTGGGELRNTGTLDVIAGSQAISTTVRNQGTINYTSFGLNLGVSGSLINEVGALFDIQGSRILSGSGGASQFSNAGTLRQSFGSGSGSSFTAPLSNTGTVEVASGLQLQLTSIAQLSGTTLTGGTWTVSGTLDILSSSNIATIASGASVTLSGSSSSFPKITAFNTNQGSFTVTGGKTFVGSATVAFTNSGTLTLEGGAFLESIPIAFNQTAGALVLANGGAMSGVGNVTVSGGVLRGSGSISTPTLTNAATIAPGTSPGILTITGNYTQTSAGILNIEVQGTNAATPDFDQLLITGSATLAGTLNVTLLNNFIPDKSESFRIMTFASRAGDFATRNLPQMNGRTIMATDAQATFYDLLGNTLIVRNTNDSGRSACGTRSRKRTWRPMSTWCSSTSPAPGRTRSSPPVPCRRSPSR